MVVMPSVRFIIRVLLTRYKEAKTIEINSTILMPRKIYVLVFFTFPPPLKSRINEIIGRISGAVDSKYEN